MDGYDTNKMQKVIIDNNKQYEYNVSQEIKIFKQTLISEIDDIFRYYKVNVSYSSVESLIDDIIFSIKNNLGYKKMMIMISDEVEKLRCSAQNKKTNTVPGITKTK